MTLALVNAGYSFRSQAHAWIGVLGLVDLFLIAFSGIVFFAHVLYDTIVEHRKVDLRICVNRNL